MNTTHRSLLAGAAAALLLCACDDGRIHEHTDYDTSGRTVRLTANVAGASTWGSDYTIALAGFAAGSDYSSILRVVRPDAEGNVSMVMKNVPDEVTSIELCAVNLIHQRVATLAAATAAQLAAADTIRFDAGNVDASMFGAIQQNVFNTTCANCHGASSTAAAGLYLTEGHARAALVGRPSKLLNGLSLVEPGDSANSALHRALFTQASKADGWHYDHSREVVSTLTMRLIDDWIQGGAE